MQARGLQSPLFILIAAGLVLGLGMGVRQTFGLFIDPMSADLSISVASISLAIAIQNLLWGLATPFCGALADRYGTGKLLATGGVLYVGGLLLTALAQGPFAVFMGAGVWHPDGKSLFLASDRGGTMNIWRVPIDSVSGVVQGEITAQFYLEFLEFFVVAAGDPARRINVDRFKLAVDTIFILEPVSNHVELQNTDCTKDQVIVGKRPE